MLTTSRIASVLFAIALVFTTLPSANADLIVPQPDPAPLLEMGMLTMNEISNVGTELAMQQPNVKQEPGTPQTQEEGDTRASAKLSTVDTPKKAVSASPKVTGPAAYPARLVIPSIGLDTSIEPVGINNKGEMAVPSGNSNDVGWYEYGTLPGNVGSAVLDAHVFAAFSDLKNLKPGSDVYVVTNGNQKLHFVVSEARVYALGELTSDLLFNRKGARRLNLITCAGGLTTDGSTYTHRLVVYTKLAG